MTKEDSELSVEELLKEMRKPPANRAANGDFECKFVRLTKNLTGNVKTALDIAVADRNVTNREIAMFLVDHAGIQASVHMVQRHRASSGCIGCSHGITE